mmetsp:Transcript_57621/g.89697  ORF Transcript_57621/g.89697 Transcript_57621/m.89697 type:complete len:366 (+) Transcript_57621:56-1153(+)
MSALGEQEPLLGERRERRLFQVSKYVNANVPWLMIVSNTIQWIITVATVFSSYYYMEKSWKTFTPKCWEYNGKPLLIACHVTGLCFWTFPLACAIIVIITFWRHLYESRLYYECIVHRILVNYDNDATFKSPLTWTFMLYGFMAVSVVWFHKASISLQELSIYLSPLVSFFMLFMGLWQVEGQLIPLPKFYETDPDLAQEVLSQSVYSTDECLRVAFEEVEESLAEKDSVEPLTSEEYFGLISEAIKVENSRSAKVSTDKVEISESLSDRFMAKLDLEKVEEFGFGRQVSRPDVLTWTHLFRKRNWWIHRLLFSKNVSDHRSVSFRHWALAHNVLASFCMLSILETYIGTTVDWFSTQRSQFGDS